MRHPIPSSQATNLLTGGTCLRGPRYAASQGPVRSPTKRHIEARAGPSQAAQGTLDNFDYRARVTGAVTRSVRAISA